jgi:hypothetical protein
MLSYVSTCHLLARCFAELFYDPEDGGDTFLRNVRYHSTHYTASYPRRRHSSCMSFDLLYSKAAKKLRKERVKTSIPKAP